RPPELPAALRVLDTEDQGLTRDADRLEGERREGASPSGDDDLRGGGRSRQEPCVIVLKGDTSETTRRVDRVENADERPGVVALCEEQSDAVEPARGDHERFDQARSEER